MRMGPYLNIGWDLIYTVDFCKALSSAVILLLRWSSVFVLGPF